MRWLLAILLRRHLPGIAVMSALVGVAGVTVLPSYATAYQTAAARAAAVEMAAHNGAALVLYGRLDPPGTAAAMYLWEMGAFITIGVAVVSALLAVRLTRGLDSDGTVEIVRAAGLSPRSLAAASGLVLVVAASTAGGASTAGLLVHRGSDGVTTAGALAWGGVVAVTFLLTAAVTALAAQLVATVAAARGLGMAFVGLAFIARAAADTTPGSSPGGSPGTSHGSYLATAPDAFAGVRHWLGALSPLGLRGEVTPFGTVRWGPLLAALAAASVIGCAEAWIWARRELHAALLAPATRHTARWRRPTRLPVRSVAGFLARSTLGATLGWMIGIALLTGFFVGMGGDVVASARAGRLDGGLLEAQLGHGDPAQSYLAYVGTIVAILTAGYAVLHVTGHAAAEREGTLEVLRGTGGRPWRPLLGYAVTAAGASACVLLGSGAVAALVAPAVLPGDDMGSAAWQQVTGQWPGIAALAGVAAAAVGIGPRWSALAWAIAGMSAGLVLLGTLVKAPDWLIDLAAFGHVPVSGFVAAQAILLVVGVVATFGAALLVSRRDLAA